VALTPERLKRLRARRRAAAERTFPNRVDILRGRLQRDPDYGDEAAGQTVPPAVDTLIPARWRTSSVREREMASRPQATAYLTLIIPAGRVDGEPLVVSKSDALLLTVIATTR
jgi:hypothetical protein